ncbi:ABC transporter ATP-binding protein [Altererythrobacter sp. MTPC7]|uniref:ABC transporter ATP-binding protein n=1 Tax=Altererythrobacter sp. MTPC7 TaxID=3056567 RepID=UPI0036F21C91
MLSAEKLSLAGRLDGVSAALEIGKVTAICGPNGAGKSTLLSCLAGTELPQAGRVMLGQDDLNRLPARIRGKRLGYLPQAPEIAWDIAAKALVRLGRLPHRDRGDAAVERAIAALDLEALRHRPASQLSGGERARVLLARVLAGEPEWILADEPLAALDLAHQISLLRMLRARADAGTGVVMVVHDLSLAMNHADRVIVLDRGRVVADGQPEDALSPENLRAVWQVEARWLGEAHARALTVS